MHRFFVCVALILTVSALAIDVVHAQATPTTDGGRDQISVHKMFLKFASPDAVLQRLGWRQDMVTPGKVPSGQGGFDVSAYPFHPPLSPLPKGVTHAYAIEGDNSLLVFATPDGFARVKALVQPFDDDAQVQIKTEFIGIATADVDALGFSLTTFLTADPVPSSFTSGAGATQFIALLNKTKSRTDTLAIRTTFNDTPVFVDREELAPYLPHNLIMQLQNTDSAFEEVVRPVTIWAHINADSSVTLAVDVSLDDGEPFVAPPTDKTEGQVQPPFFAAPLIVQTVPSGDTLALRFTLPSKSATAPSQDLIVLITPTVLDGGDAAAKPTASAAPPVAH